MNSTRDATTKHRARARLLSLSPTKSSPPPPPPTPATSGDLRRRAARPRAPHGPRLPSLRPNSLLPASTACSQPHPVARVSGRAPPARLRRPQMQMEHDMGVPHPPRSPPSRASSRRCEGRHEPAAMAEDVEALEGMSSCSRIENIDVALLLIAAVIDRVSSVNSTQFISR